VTLSTGYRAYQSSDAAIHNNSNSGSNQKKRAAAATAAAKRVRFVKGHVTIPDDILALSRRDRPQQQQGLVRVGGGQTPRVGGGGNNGDGDGGDEGGEGEIDEVGLGVGVGREGDEEAVGDEEVEMGGEAEVHARLVGAAGARPADGLGQHAKVGNDAGRLVERGGIVVWRKEPRFRGSGTLALLDDPVRDGERLAREGRGSARGRWRDRGWAEEDCAFDAWERTELGRGVGVLRWKDGEREAAFTLGDIDRWEEPLMAMVVPMRQRKGTGLVKAGEIAQEQMQQPQPQPEGSEAVAASVTLTNAGSDSERDDDDGYDFLADLSLDEAKGWVPVMVADDDEGDDWMSLTGSWVMMGPQTSHKGDVALA
jgi:hypothetical protein